MTRDELETLREGWDFEAKLALGRDGRGALSESLWETYSAMANTEGGVILLGAAERTDGSLELRGIPDVERVERSLWDNLQNPQKVSVNLLGREHVKRVEVDGNTLLVLHVPKAGRAHRPVYLNGSWEKKTYLRVHEGDRVADRDVARRMLADAQPDRDAQVLEGYDAGDLYGESVRRYRQFFASKRPDHPFLSEDDAGFLRKIGALGQDRARGVSGITLAGLLMLGKEESIRDRFPHWHLSYRELPSAPLEGQRWLDRVAPDGTWNANVFEFYSRSIVKLHEGLKVPFSLEAGQYRRDDTPAHTALREALVNALIHADYEGRTGVRVLREPSGYEFINPGLLLVSPQKFWEGGASEPRNPVLQRLFGLLQLGEREGSGGPAIRQAWAQQHWRAPLIREDVEQAETHLQLRQVSLLPRESVETLRAWLGQRFDSLDELGRLALVTAHAEGSFTHAQLKALTSVHSRDVTLKLQELIRKGLLIASGPPRALSYALPTQAEPPSRPALAVEVAEGASDYGTLEGVAPGSIASPALGGGPGVATEGRADGGLPRAPSAFEGSRPSFEESRTGSEGSWTAAEPEKAISESSEESQTRPETAPETTRPWAPKEQQYDALLAFCADGWRTLLEIATALGRTESTVRTEYLRPLLAQGRLERRHPESPRHPHQAYRTVRTERLTCRGRSPSGRSFRSRCRPPLVSARTRRRRRR